jgi:hypothetical protein
MNDDENEFFRSRHYKPDEGAAPRGRLPFHPLANNFPMMDRTSPEFRGLVASIKQVGLTEPITMHEGMVLDGRNRLLACEEAGVEPRFEVFDDSEQTPLAFVLAKNLYRRHLTEGQRAIKAEEMVTSKHGDINRFTPKPTNVLLGDTSREINDIASKQTIVGLRSEPVTIAKAAALWCVNPRAVQRAAFVRTHTETTPKIIAEVKSGRMTLGRAAVLAKLTDEEQSSAPDVKFGGRKPKPKPAARPVTVPAIRTLTDEQFLAIVIRDLPRLNRAAAREGMVLTYLPQHQ